jgi:hypothetical protein
MAFMRYMRLTPAIAILILIDRVLAEIMMNEHTPPEFLDYSVHPCEKNWWMLLLHLNGYARSDQIVRKYIVFDTNCDRMTFLVHDDNLVCVDRVAIDHLHRSSANLPS